jgi:hypothetical protein
MSSKEGRGGLKGSQVGASWNKPYQQLISYSFGLTLTKPYLFRKNERKNEIEDWFSALGWSHCSTPNVGILEYFSVNTKV